MKDPPRRPIMHSGGDHMLSKKEKQLLLDIGMEYEPVCVKYTFDKPKGLKEVDETLSIRPRTRASIT